MSLRLISQIGASTIKSETDASRSVKKEPKALIATKSEVGKKRTHRQAKATTFLDVEAKEEQSDEEEDNRRTTRKSDIKAESGKFEFDEV